MVARVYHNMHQAFVLHLSCVTEKVGLSQKYGVSVIEQSQIAKCHSDSIR